ncbi:MAG: MFS transporter [Gammaproteobacteria bacterium]|nr:MFS transporter [Gammaproteobacteria bacterium]
MNTLMPPSISRAVEPREKVSRRTVAGYGFGDFGFNLYATGLNLYLLYYYTDVLGLDPALAGLIFMIPVIWDGISDPLMGWIATRTRTRLGKFRPYILFGAPFVGLSFVGMFAAPVWFPDQVVVASLISHLLFRTMYTVASVPYSSLAAAITHDSQERGTMAAVRIMSAMAGGVVTAATLLELAKYFGDGNLREGFVMAGLLYALIATLVMSLVFFTTSEKTVAATQERLTTAQTLAFVKSNTAFWLLCAASFVGIIGSTMGGKALVYYISYYAGHPDAVSTIMPLGILGACAGIPVWTLVARKYSKRAVWIMGGGGAVMGNCIILALEVTDVATLSALAIFSGVCGGSVAVMFWSMLPDTVEFGEWRSGVRDDGILFGLCQFISKAGSGLGVGMIGLLLSFIGYSANETQTEVALQGIRMAAFLIPAVCSLGSIALIALYPLDALTHGRIVRALLWKRRKAGA